MAVEKDLEKMIDSIFESALQITLKNEKGDAVEEFRIDLSELVFLGKETSKIELKDHCLLLFTFTEGYYVSKDSYYVFVNSSIFEAMRKPVKKFDFFKLNEKAKEWEFFYKQTLSSEGEYEAALAEVNDKLRDFEEANQSYLKKRKLLTKIADDKAAKRQIQEKLNTNSTVIQELKKIILQKKNDISIAKTILKNNNSKFELLDTLFNLTYKVVDTPCEESSTISRPNEKYQSIILQPSNLGHIVARHLTPVDLDLPIASKDKEEAEKVKKKVEKFRIMLAALKNKKVAELTYFFFNTICDKFYIIPTLGTEEPRALHLFFEKHYKELSVMTGVISQMLNYLSYIFNISLRYPLLVNGSKSYVIKNKKE